MGGKGVHQWSNYRINYTKRGAKQIEASKGISTLVAVWGVTNSILQQFKQKLTCAVSKSDYD